MPTLRIFQDSRAMGTCRSCGAAVEWAELSSGKRHPFNAPIVVAQTQTSLLDTRVIELIENGPTTSHFATCADAKAWRG